MNDLPYLGELPSNGLLDPLTRYAQKYQKNWSSDDTNRQLGYLLLHGLDWGQTKSIARNPNKYYETNPILGKHPSAGDVDRYFALTGLGHVGLSLLLSDPKWRKRFQNVTIGLEREGGTPSSTQYTEGALRLNLLIKSWHGLGMTLWTNKIGYILPQTGV